MCLPVLYGYTSIVYRSPVYSPYLPVLSKLMILSSATVQVVMSSRSNMPFSIGQVQDAGLLFLSSMADRIASDTNEDGDDPAVTVTTAIVLLPFYTVLTGLALVVIGRLRLASTVAYIPTPVVGGYLGFIGYFCLQAGVALCVSKPMATIESWASVMDLDSMRLGLPGLVAAAVMLIVSRKQPDCLPHVMVATPAVFYVAVFAYYGVGNGLEGARGDKWIGSSKGGGGGGVEDVWNLFQFSLVRWDLAGELLPTWIGMVFVIAFSSSLDVAAISMDMGKPLDTDRELETVGYCNVASGCLGGYTGSYIFSQVRRRRRPCTTTAN